LTFEFIEAAQVDGANSIQVFFKIKLHMIKTPALISSIVLTMSNFNNVTIPMILTSGGPGEATNVITLMLYRMGFGYYQFGLASALSFLVLLFNIILVVIYVKAVKYKI
jgi:ABC-type sugar transport system permease subunit